MQRPSLLEDSLVTSSPLSTPKAIATEAQKSSEPALYDRDYLAWVETTLQRLKQKDYDSVDWDNLIEEISDMSRSEKRRLTGNLIIVLLHLLKWQYQFDRRSRSWESSIAEHRRRLIEALDTSPSLNLFMKEALPNAYANSTKQAAIETGLSRQTFPVNCPYEIAQILDDKFLPE